MEKSYPYGKIFSIINKAYSLCYLFYFALVRFLFSTITTITISIVPYPMNAARGNGLLSSFFHPLILVGFVVVLGILAWRDKTWLTQMVYPAIVLLLVYGSLYLL
ncbi:hypothetical protein [Enterococcus sp. DIV0876]|uniref:hypothetical protein n=1 Tax=Enterococcus sp. DIV0876 TaxID=2774633 RepID=UPI003D2FDAE4